MDTTFDYKDGIASAYLALPETKPAAGVLVCHAWWGLNDFFKSVCDRLASEGFVAVAPDLYEGKTATTIEDAMTLRKALDRKVVNKQLKGAVQHLLSLEATEGGKIAVLGCSLGANFAYWVSDNCANEVAAVVALYGVGSGNFSRTRAAYLGHYAETDDWGANPERVNKLKDKLVQQGREVTFYTYPGTKHWFFESDVADAYDAEAAQLAWDRTIAFLKENV